MTETVEARPEASREKPYWSPASANSVAETGVQRGREVAFRLGEELPIPQIKTYRQIGLLGGGILATKRLKLRRREVDGVGCLLTKCPPWQYKDEQRPDQ